MENVFKSQNKEYSDESFKLSTGPGLYSLNEAYTTNTISFPWAPTTVYHNKYPLSTINGVSYVDIESDLKNMDRILSNNPSEKYSPDENKKYGYNFPKDGFFHQESTLLNNPPAELKGMTKNRFINLFHNPQDEALEPWKNREGDNTYLNLIDNYVDCNDRDFKCNSDESVKGKC